jgi:hypothetical protein
VASAERPTSNVERNYHDDDPVCGEAVLASRLLARVHPYVLSSLASRVGLCRQDFSAHEAKKCYNFGLAMSGNLTASCMSTRTATLLLVVDRYSQVLGAAVHQYCQLIRNLNPPLPP